MIKKLAVIWCMLLTLSSVSQSTRFVYSLDSTYVPSNSYIKDYSVETYKSSNLGNKAIDYQNLDVELLNAAVFFALNKERVRRNKKVLEYSPELDFLAYNCTKFFSKSKFRPSKRNDLLYEKNLYLAARNMPIKQHLFEANTSLVSIMDLEPKRKYHKNPEDGRSAYGLYYRKEEDADKDELEDIVQVLTYNEFAQKVVEAFSSRASKKRLRSKSYETMACYVLIEPNSLNKGKAPYAKVIQIIGARRLVSD